jgi:hypothetical protein
MQLMTHHRGSGGGGRSPDDLLRGSIIARHLDVAAQAPWAALATPRRSGWHVLAGDGEDDSSDGTCYSTADPNECNPGQVSLSVCTDSVIYAGDDGCSNQTSYGVPCTPDTSDGPGCEPRSSVDLNCEA